MQEIYRSLRLTKPEFPLTEKQRIFCIEYIFGVEAYCSSKAAEKAGYNGETSKCMAIENLKKPTIASYINDLSKLRKKADSKIEQQAYDTLRRHLSKPDGVRAARHILDCMARDKDRAERVEKRKLGAASAATEKGKEISTEISRVSAILNDKKLDLDDRTDYIKNLTSLVKTRLDVEAEQKLSVALREYLDEQNGKK